MNKIEVTGSIARNGCVVQKSKNGLSYCNFTIASRQSKKSKSVDFFNVCCFGEIADKMGTYGKHGTIVLVKGYLKIVSWQDTKGVKRKNPQITATFIALDETTSDDVQNTEVDELLENRAYLDNEDVSDVEINSDELPF